MRSVPCVAAAILVLAARPAAAQREPTPEGQPATVCIVDGRELREVPITFTAAGDSLVDGRPLDEVYPQTSPPYSGDADWYLQHAPVVVDGRRYFKYGLSRWIEPDSLAYVADWRGTPLFAERGVPLAQAGYVYAPVSRGCRFHPYGYSDDVRPVEPESSR